MDVKVGEKLRGNWGCVGVVGRLRAEGGLEGYGNSFTGILGLKVGAKAHSTSEF